MTRRESVGRTRLAAAVVLLSVLTAGVGKAGNAPPYDASSNAAFSPVPAPVGLNAGKVRLGFKLFTDTRLSANGTIACVSCHDLGSGGADSRPISVGVGGSLLQRNTPTVFNASLNAVLMWDGRFETLEEQAERVILNPEEMGSSWGAVLAALSADPDYRTAFAILYPDGITPAAVTDAIATFERSLVTPNSRFDQWLAGNQDALTPMEQEGLRLFKVYGCAACHQGAALGGNLYHKIGLVRDYYGQLPAERKVDTGRFGVTNRLTDTFFFRVPPLRNIELTAPYLHDGSVATLEAAVALMARHQLGRELAPREVTALVMFLKTLTGDRVLP